MYQPGMTLEPLGLFCAVVIGAAVAWYIAENWT